MHKWINVFNESDFKYILKEYEEIDNELLIPYFDILMAEDNELKDSDDYDLHLEKIDDKLWNNFIIQACKLCIMTLKYGMIEDAKILINDFNLKIKIDDSKLIDRIAIEKLEKRIKQIKTAIEVNAIQELEESKGNKKTVWEDLIVYIHQVLGISIDYNCSVALYRSYDKQAKALISAKNKRNG